MLPWVVRELPSGTITGSTRYHDIVADIDRVEIGYTWYSKSRQRTSVNMLCKLLLLGHAFESLGCKVVGLRTDTWPRARLRHGRIDQCTTGVARVLSRSSAASKRPR